MVTDRKSSWHRGWADFKLYCLLNSREGVLHSKKTGFTSQACTAKWLFSNPLRPVENNFSNNGFTMLWRHFISNFKFKKTTSNNYFPSWGCNGVTKCCLNAISRKCWVPTHTFLETQTDTHEHTHTLSTHTLTETHIFLAIPCCILTSNSAFNSKSGWVGISVSWMDPTLIQ